MPSFSRTVTPTVAAKLPLEGSDALRSSASSTSACPLVVPGVAGSVNDPSLPTSTTSAMPAIVMNRPSRTRGIPNPSFSPRFMRAILPREDGPHVDRSIRAE